MQQRSTTKTCTSLLMSSLALGGSLLAGCVLVYESEFLVTFDAEPDTRAQTVAIEYEVVGPGGATSGPHVVTLEQFEGFPTAELPIRPLEGDWHRTFLLSARALRAGPDGSLEVFNERSFRSTFAPPGPLGRQQHSLLFSDDCILFNLECAEGETCVEGRCAPIPYIPPPGRPPEDPLREVPVSTAAELADAVRDAGFGDSIVIAPGDYDIEANLVSAAGGAEGAPIVVRPREPGTVRLRYVGAGVAELFVLRHPYWVIEGLDLEGACPDDNDCEHGVHVTARATHTVLRNNRMVDFNQAIHVNAGRDGTTPDDGLIEQNEITLTGVRDVDNVVSGIRLAHASRWVVRNNVFRDLVHATRTAYATYFVGNGQDGRFEANLVECERDVVGGGTRVGFSVGAAESGPQHTRAILRNDVIRGCSVVIRACTGCLVEHNTVEGDVRAQAGSTVTSLGNLVTGALSATADSSIDSGDDLVEVSLADHVVDPASDLRPRATAGTSGSAIATDFCGDLREAPPSRGALDRSATCPGTWAVGARGGP